MHPQSTDDRALRLHSCRALSSRSQPYVNSERKICERIDKPHTCDPWLLNLLLYSLYHYPRSGRLQEWGIEL